MHLTRAKTAGGHSGQNSMNLLFIYFFPLPFPSSLFLSQGFFVGLIAGFGAEARLGRRGNWYCEDPHSAIG